MQHGDVQGWQATRMASARTVLAAAAEQMQYDAVLVAAELAGGISLAEHRQREAWSTGAQQSPAPWSPSVPVNGDAAIRQAYEYSLYTGGYSCAVNSCGQPSTAPPPVVRQAPAPPRGPAAQGPGLYSVGIDEYYSPGCNPGRGANGTPYAACAGNSSTRVQAPAPQPTPALGALSQHVPPVAGAQKAHATRQTTDKRCFGSGVASMVPTWLSPQPDACLSAHSAQAGRDDQAAVGQFAPQHQAQHDMRLAAVTRSASEAAAAGKTVLHSGSGGIALPVSMAPAHAPTGAEHTGTETAAVQQGNADCRSDSLAADPADVSSGSPGQTDDCSDVFACKEPSVEAESSSVIISVSSESSHSASDAASGMQLTGDSPDLAAGSPPRSPASRLATPVSSCTASLAAGSDGEATISASDVEPAGSDSARCDAVQSGVPQAAECTRTLLRSSRADGPATGSIMSEPNAGDPRNITWHTSSVQAMVGADASPTPAGVAALIADLVATHGDLLDTAPADRLPFEALATPQGSPEPEGPPEGIAAGLASGDDEDEPSAAEVGAEAAPAAVVGPAARPKRTAGGDPMDVRALPQAI